MLPLQFGEAIEGDLHAHLVSVGKIDAADGRTDQIFERFIAQPAANKTAQRLIAGIAARRYKRFFKQAQLAAGRKQR